jgi:ribosomal protein L27
LAQNNNVASVVARKLNNQSLLNEMASNENMDSIARSYAIKKINDQSVLAGIARKGGRYLAGDNGMGTDHFNLHLLAVKHLTDQKILADLAENSEDEYIRNTAIKRIDELNNR